MISCAAVLTEKNKVRSSKKEILWNKNSFCPSYFRQKLAGALEPITQGLFSATRAVTALQFELLFERKGVSF